MIHARGLLKRFGDLVAVDGIDLDVKRGEAFGFLGPNGAGKSSTMRMIGCVSPVTAGTLRILGQDPGTNAPEIRRSLHEGDVAAAAKLLGRPPELDGIVVGGDQRGGTLGYPTANLAVEPGLLVPAYGIYAGAALDHRAAISIGTNPHYGGDERRIEPHLLDFDGDLYGRRLVVELWERLRDEQVFASEQDLIDQIARDVEATRKAARPA